MNYSYCYILYSPQSKKFYISSTDDLKKDVQLHNDGHIPKTRKNKPWNLLWYSAFRINHDAEDFVRFLQTGIGKEFMNKWFIPFTVDESQTTQDRPPDAKTCPLCHGSGEAINEIFYKYGQRLSKKPTMCLTCVGKGWIDPSKETQKIEE